ncbi:protein of unknown function [Methylacidimicrobium sp. AP8]|nr:protein of unknown function [Methylacidimicrobium sp. AP8]
MRKGVPWCFLSARVSVCANETGEWEVGVRAIPTAAGRVRALLADTGYPHGEEVEALQAEAIEMNSPMRAEARECRRRYEFRPADRRREKPVAYTAPWRRKRIEKLASPEWPPPLCSKQADGRTGLRHHQIGDGLPGLSAPRASQSPGRMVLGLLGVQLPAPWEAWGSPQLRFSSDWIPMVALRRKNGRRSILVFMVPGTVSPHAASDCRRIAANSRTKVDRLLG